MIAEFAFKYQAIKCIENSAILITKLLWLRTLQSVVALLHYWTCLSIAMKNRL